MPAKLSLSLVALVVTIPVGVVHAPDAVVQNKTLSCLIEEVTVVVNENAYVVAALPARESDMITFAGVKVPACTNELNGNNPSEHSVIISTTAILDL